MEDSGTQQAATLHDHLQIIRRGRWMILAAVVLVPLGAASFSLRQEKLYEALADVLVSQGTSGFDLAQSADRVLQTQADVATASPEVARRVREALRLRTTPPIEVTPKLDSNILVFSSTATTPLMAARVSTEYARQFKDFQREIATADVERELLEVESDITELARDGVNPASALYTSLISKREELRTLKALQTSRAFLVRPATLGVQVQPRPMRSTILGLVLGLILGLGLAYLREALDTRVRSTDEVAARLGVPLLARVPEPPKRLRRNDRLVMIDDPDAPEAQAFRMLRTNLDFVRVDKDARALMVTSAVAGEGKSTTAANLAVALARVGQRVALVDLDLRRPFLHKFFNLEGPGVTEVAIGYATLDDALARIPLNGTRRRGSWNGNPDGVGPAEGTLDVLPAGPMPPNVDEFLASHALAAVLGELRNRADTVLLDSPPLLFGGDAMALTAAVDALLIITRMNVVRRPMLRELRRVLDAIPLQKLGFVPTGPGSDEIHFGYVVYQRRSHPRPQEPVG